MGFRIHIEDPYLDGEVHFLVANGGDEYIRRILCFPACSDTYTLEHRVRRLIEDGFVYILETGSIIHGLRILGKGYSSIVVVALHKKHGLGVLKLRRTDSRRADLSREAEMMAKAASTGIAPRLYRYSSDYIFRELLDPVKCQPVERVLETLIARGLISEVRRVLHTVLTALHRLDKASIDHTELNRPGDHLLFCPEGVKVIDWESARESEKPGNLTSFTSFILYRFRYSSKLVEELGLDKARVLEELRKYKQRYDEESFNRVLEVMRVSC